MSHVNDTGQDVNLRDLYIRYVLVTEAFSHRFRVRSLEWFLALAMLLVGLELLRTGATFDLTPYVYLRGLAAENTWGWGCVILGGVRLVLLTVNGALPRGSPHLRAGLSGISMLVWGNLAAGYAASLFPTLMLSFVVPATLFEFLNVYRAAKDARAEDTGPRHGVG